MTQLIEGSQIQVVNGATYRARVNLRGAEAIFGSSTALRKKFEELGFTNVKVWASPSKVPGDWPDDERVQEQEGDTYFAEGTWGKKTQSEARDPRIVAIWEHAPPAKKKPNWTTLAQLARLALRDAWALEAPGVDLPLDVEQLVLAIGHYEGAWGYPENDPVWFGSNNWGAITVPGPGSGTPASQPMPPAPPGSFVHLDHDKDGRPIWQFYAIYPDPTSGARALVHELKRRPTVWASLPGAVASDVAEAMHDTKYFVQDPGIYAKNVFGHAKTVAKLLGEPLRVRMGAGKVGWVLGGLGAVTLGGAAAWWYVRTR